VKGGAKFGINVSQHEVENTYNEAKVMEGMPAKIMFMQ